MSVPDLYNLLARHRGKPEGWRWFSLEAIEGGILVNGAVCTATYTKGKWSGSTNWSKRDKSTECRMIATKSDLDAVRDAWEVENGKCASCGGGGQELCGFSGGTNQYRECRRCDGAGFPLAAHPTVTQ